MREYTKRELIRKYNLKNKIFFFLDNFINDLKNIKKTKKQNIILTTARLDTSEKFKGIDETMESISLVNKHLSPAFSKQVVVNSRRRSS